MSRILLTFLCALLAPLGAWAEASPALTVALVTTPNGEGVSELRLQPATAPSPARAVATLRHLPGAAVRASLLPGSTQVLVVTDVERMRDPSFAGVLFLLEPGKSPRRLADRIAQSTRALVTEAGRLFVPRGMPGDDAAHTERTSATLRTDALTVDEVFLDGRPPRTVHRFSGQTAFLAGALGKELFVYRVSGREADLCAIHLETGHTRVLAQVLPFARDFSVDRERRALLYVNRHPDDPRVFRIERLSLAGGAPEVLGGDSRSAALLPFTGAGGEVLFNPESARGLQSLQSAHAPQSPLTFPSPFGPGVDTLRAWSAQGDVAALLHSPPGGGAQKLPWLLDRASGHAWPLAVSPDTRVDIAGFVNGGAVP